MDNTRELRLTMRLKNNRIRAKREALGLTAREAAKKCGFSVDTWYAYESLRAKPYGKQGGFGGEVGWTPSADKIAMLLGVTCEWLWPDQVLAVTNPKIKQEVDGYVVDLPPHDATDRIALGCVFARDLTEAIARLDTMRAALVAERATTPTEDTDDAR